MTYFAKMSANLSIAGNILDIDRFTSHDGPGIRSTVFLMGCPLRCIWCHSPESQSDRPQLFYQITRCQDCRRCISVCPVNAIQTRSDGGGIAIDRKTCTACGACCQVCLSKALTPGGSQATVGEILSVVKKDKAYYENSGGGVTLSGGELLMQPEFSFHFLQACKDQDIHTAVETSGFGSEKDMHRIASVTDLILFDLKALDKKQHRAFTGVSNSTILCNLESLCATTEVRKKIVIRIPCIPSINDSVPQITSIARYVRGLGLKKVELLRYNEVAGAKYDWINKKYELEEMKTQDDEAMDNLSALCTQEGLELVRYI